MKVLILMLVALVFTFAMAGCQDGNQRGRYNHDAACYEELEVLMGDQPGFAASPWCDSSFVGHLEAVR